MTSASPIISLNQVSKSFGKSGAASSYVAVDQLDLQIAHESGRRHPEIIPHQDDRLDMLAVALAQGIDQFGILLTPPGVEPLLELVEDQEHLLARSRDPSPRGGVPAMPAGVPGA